MSVHSHAPGAHDEEGQNRSEEGKAQSNSMRKMYLRFAAMILTAMVVMYVAMFAGTYAWSHVRLSENRIFMAMTMGGAMALVMIAWMLKMYKNTKANIAIVVAGAVLLAGGVYLERSQILVQDVGFMTSMIPHHSLAITQAERAQIADVRVCELAVEISSSQRREIQEMDWLIQDIRENGTADTVAEANARPVPDYSVPAERQCPTR